MGHLITVATCSLRQWALDWEGNAKRIIESIHLAKDAGARLRVGPDSNSESIQNWRPVATAASVSLPVLLVNTEIDHFPDHFKEGDTFLHSLEMLCRILSDESTWGIICDIGVPIVHKNVPYNCRVICLDGKILMIRPKRWLAKQGAATVPFGDALLTTLDTVVGVETCEELFTPDAPHISMSLDGCEIFTNASSSHWEITKLETRLALICGGTKKAGGVYLYANQSGCDGDRILYDGCALIILNGDIVAQGEQFGCRDVEVVTATIDLEEVRSYRSSCSRQSQAAKSTAYPRIHTAYELGPEEEDYDITKRRSTPIEPRLYSLEEEIALAGGCYLWDYLRRSGQAGYLVPLSGGIDSCATATIVFSMCRIVMKAVQEGNPQVIEDVKRIAKYKGENVLPESPQDLCNQIFSTIYMGMETMSSPETRKRAKDLAEAIGSYHIDLNIDDVYKAQKALLVQTTGFEPKFKVEGGSHAENITLQCLQARIRMVTAYQYGQILPTVRNRPGAGSLLVLGSANVGESLRGYLTKYVHTPFLLPPCLIFSLRVPFSSTVMLIGDQYRTARQPTSIRLESIGLDKADLKRFILWAKTNFEIPCLQEFLSAPATAELEPITNEYVQADEADMGFTYDELTVLGRLRKEAKLGPYGMFQRLVHDWSADYTPTQVAKKCKDFFHYYAINRHKMTTLTPSLHAQPYSPDDNRFDMRPFLYPSFWQSWSFKRIDAELKKMEAQAKKGDAVEAEID
ncbi:glutamine dependent NAD+ synthetase [Apiospora kogelbergensis]|uniref:glutamine dependent NAD+ synthetase n=1 Tax=Apiospora kogelbergensis TaxID=1337665 RepID=UPI0031319C98